MALKFTFLLLSMLVAVLAETYTDKYDNIDLDEILSNKRLLQSYTNCILDKGRCNAEGKELKEHMDDALKTGCEKCTESQRKGAQRVIEHLIKNEIEIWRELAAKFDPEGTFRKKYEDEAKSKGIVIPE